MGKTRSNRVTARAGRSILTALLILAVLWACGVAAWRIPAIRPPGGLVQAWSTDGSADAHLAWSDAPSEQGLSFVVRVRNPLARTLLGRFTFAPQSLYVRVTTDGSLRLHVAELAAGGVPELLAVRDARAWTGMTLAEMSQMGAPTGHGGLSLRQAVQEALSSAARELVRTYDATSTVPGVGSMHVPFEVLNSVGVWVTEMDAQPRGLLLLEIGPYCGQCLDVLESVVSFLSRQGSAYPRLVLLVRGRAADLGRLEARVRGVRADYVLDPGGAVARALLGSDGTASCALMDAAGTVRFSGSALDRSNALLEALSALEPGTGQQGT